MELLGAFNGRTAVPSVTWCREGAKLFDRIFYVVRGTISFDLAGGTHLDAPAGSVVFLPNNCTYRSYWTAEGEGEFFSVNYILRENGSMLALGDRVTLLVHDSTKKYHSLIKRMNDIWLAGGLGSDFLCISLFWELMRGLYMEIETRSRREEYDVIYQGITYLENHFAAEVTAEDLSRMCGMSLTAFRREFKRRTGISPVKYKNTLRMQKARTLLESGEYSVTEAARLVGCPDLCYFNRLFRREFGMNPSDAAGGEPPQADGGGEPPQEMGANIGSC